MNRPRYRQDRARRRRAGEAGSPLFASVVANDEVDIETFLARAESFGSPALVVGQSGSLARTLTMRESMRRFTRKTNGHSKCLETHRL